MKLKKVDYNIANQRFDRYLRKYFKPYPDIKLGDIYARIRKGAILVNNKKKKQNYTLLLGDEIKFTNIKTGDKKPNILANKKENKLNNLKLKEIAPMIIYEDKDWIVFDKPAGVVAHPSNKHVNDIAMNDYLDKYCEIKNIATENETFKPSFGYRLDKDTSGVLIAAKNYDSLQYINKIIRERNIEKEYHTIISGRFPEHLISEKSIEKIYDKKFGSSRMIVNNNGLSAKSEFWKENIKKNEILGDISLVKVKLYTGRMHQIRIHLANEGFPILGDIIYGNPVINRKLYKQLKINRQILHCSKYSFKNIDGKKISFESKLPNDFDKIMS